MMSVHWVQTLRCEHRDLILTRSAYDHKRVRPLKPMVGVVESLGPLAADRWACFTRKMFGFFKIENPRPKVADKATLVSNPTYGLPSTSACGAINGLMYRNNYRPIRSPHPRAAL
jgi:hypothetical protein